MLVNGFVTLVACDDNSQKNSVTVHLSGFRPLFSFMSMDGLYAARGQGQGEIEGREGGLGHGRERLAGAVRDQNELRDVSVSEQVLHEASSEDSTVSSGST